MPLRWQDIADILIIAYVVYRVLLFLRGTRAFQLVKGLLLILLLNGLAKFMGLQAISYFLERVISLSFIVIPIVFQPELRRGLEGLGGGFWESKGVSPRRGAQIVSELFIAITSLRESKIGAIIAFERKSSLKDFWDKGVKLGAEISAELILSIFNPRSPLHDGAVVIREDKILAASCFFPLSDREIDRRFGTRHRAALGLSEVTDAWVLVVSEERGEVSFAVNGRLVTNLNEEAIRRLLERYYFTKQRENFKDRLLSWLKGE
ncbi:MAG: diadenylate cyclase CdaA [Synergistetes bacterium]|nr:diadenylate cyclase CdaA [Synergistota bacterium]MCX8127692.1 diadenylate cyclase CdaA [Synergistota bacterium]MDW8191393.1 diadenylate cyclase CdaA [Synergistota bacterium]